MRYIVSVGATRGKVTWVFCLISWNLKNFFDPKNVREENLTSLKIRDMGKALRDARADVVCVQEVGSVEMLERLAMAWCPGGNATARLGIADDRGIACGILTRLPVLYAADHRPDALGIDLRGPKRGAVHLRVESPLGPVDVLCFHFKSRLPTMVGSPTLTGEARSDAWRAAEAASLSAYAVTLLDAHRGGHVVLAGDANDEPGSATLAALRGATFEELIAPLPSETRATCMFQGQPMTLDHILVSRALRAQVTEVLVHNAKLRDHGPLLGAARLTVDSDHAAVSARFSATQKAH